ncbi:MAG: 5-oxoprolinase subunit PxpB [Bacteroidota bacterium]
MSTYPITVKPFGAHAVLVEWPHKVEEAILGDVLQFCKYLEKRLDKNNWEYIPAYNSLTLIHRKEIIDYVKLKKALKDWYAENENSEPLSKFLWRLPVCYDLDLATDLEEVAHKLKKTVSEVMALHTQQVYTVYGIGFLPGFMYLGGLPMSLEVPRKSTPRLKVDKGSVGLAGKQTGIYPQESPGGWNIIGNCPIPIFNMNKEEPCFVSVGDKIQFYPISRAAYDLHKIEGEVGIYQLEKLEIDA